MNILLVRFSKVLFYVCPFFFQGGEASFTVVIPDNGVIDASAESSLCDMQLLNNLKKTYYEQINLFMPKFTLEQTVKLAETLKKVSFVTCGSTMVCHSSGELFHPHLGGTLLRLILT